MTTPNKTHVKHPDFDMTLCGIQVADEQPDMFSPVTTWTRRPDPSRTIRTEHDPRNAECLACKQTSYYKRRWGDEDPTQRPLKLPFHR